MGIRCSRVSYFFSSCVWTSRSFAMFTAEQTEYRLKFAPFVERENADEVPWWEEDPTMVSRLWRSDREGRPSLRPRDEMGRSRRGPSCIPGGFSAGLPLHLPGGRGWSPELPRRSSNVRRDRPSGVKRRVPWRSYWEGLRVGVRGGAWRKSPSPSPPLLTPTFFSAPRIGQVNKSTGEATPFLFQGALYRGGVRRISGRRSRKLSLLLAGPPDRWVHVRSWPNWLSALRSFRVRGIDRCPNLGFFFPTGWWSSWGDWIAPRSRCGEPRGSTGKGSSHGQVLLLQGIRPPGEEGWAALSLPGSSSLNARVPPPVLPSIAALLCRRAGELSLSADLSFLSPSLVSVRTPSPPWWAIGVGLWIPVAPWVGFPFGPETDLASLASLASAENLAGLPV